MKKFRFPFFSKNQPVVANTKQIIDFKTGKPISEGLSSNSGGGSGLEVLKIYGTYAYDDDEADFRYTFVGIEGTFESIEAILNKDFIVKVIISIVAPDNENATYVTHATPAILIADNAPYSYLYLSFYDHNHDTLQDEISLSNSDGVIHLKASEYHETTIEDPITGNTVDLIGPLEGEAQNNES